MSKGIIQFCYRKIIDANSTKLWDKYVFDDTHQEFFMQAQYYNQAGILKTYREIIEQNPQAEKLQFLVSTAAVGYIQQLNGIVPEIVNAFGKLCLPFENFKFEIIQSHITDKQQHKIAIYFYSKPLLWIDTLDNQLLISSATEDLGELETDLIPLQPMLNIISLKSTSSSKLQLS